MKVRTKTSYHCAEVVAGEICMRPATHYVPIGNGRVYGCAEHAQKMAGRADSLPVPVEE